MRYLDYLPISYINNHERSSIHGSYLVKLPHSKTPFQITSPFHLSDFVPVPVPVPLRSGSMNISTNNDTSLVQNQPTAP
jgi:hypothetical protein